jgi:hypothetical protein
MQRPSPLDAPITTVRNRVDPSRDGEAEVRRRRQPAPADPRAEHGPTLVRGGDADQHPSGIKEPSVRDVCRRARDWLPDAF